MLDARSYDGTRYCHVKGQNSNWITDNRWDVSNDRNDVQELSVIAKCPFTTSTYKGGSRQTYTICPNTDFRGGSDKTFQNVNSAQNCAQQYSRTNGCTKAVWSAVSNPCQVKTTAK